MDIPDKKNYDKQEKAQNTTIANDLIGIWRICNPDKKQFTWSQRKPLFLSRNPNYKKWKALVELQEYIYSNL